MERDKEQADENARLQAKEQDEKMESMRAIFEQDLGCMMTKIEELQASILKNQEASERKFNDMQSKSQAQFADLQHKSQAQFAKVLEMFTKMEKNFKKS